MESLEVQMEKLELKDDFELLDIMLNDSRRQADIYQPGPYWATKASNAAKAIKRYGITDFRGSSSFIGTSYSDNMPLDIRKKYDYGLMRFVLWLTKIYPISKIFENQLHLTESYANRNIIYAKEILNSKEKTKVLLDKYKVPYSLLGNCKRKIQINDKFYSIHYLDLLEQHDAIASYINFNKVSSIFEIGGGFGGGIHLLLENYKNIRKILYLDIAPNLYVGTQYLKAIYGTGVSDYRTLKQFNSIKFSANNDIQIFCIAPWQIEKFESKVDLFLNSHSFVEMPTNVVQNYVDKFNRFPESSKAAIALTTYDEYDLKTTFNPNLIPDFFYKKNFKYFEAETLLNSSRKNLFFISA